MQRRNKKINVMIAGFPDESILPIVRAMKAREGILISLCALSNNGGGMIYLGNGETIFTLYSTKDCGDLLKDFVSFNFIDAIFDFSKPTFAIRNAAMYYTMGMPFFTRVDPGCENEKTVRATVREFRGIGTFCPTRIESVEMALDALRFLASHRIC